VDRFPGTSATWTAWNFEQELDSDSVLAARLRLWGRWAADVIDDAASAAWRLQHLQHLLLKLMMLLMLELLMLLMLMAGAAHSSRSLGCCARHQCGVGQQAPPAPSLLVVFLTRMLGGCEHQRRRW